MSKTLPIVPMRSAVLFPGMSLPITAARPQTLRAIEAALREPEQRVFAVAQRETATSRPRRPLHDRHDREAERGPARPRRRARGARGPRARHRDARDAAATATWWRRSPRPAELPPLDPKDPAFVALHREVRERAAELATRRGVPEEAVEQMLDQITEPGRLADLVAGYLDVPVAERQALLEALAIEDRLRRVLIHVQRQIEVLSAQEDIQSKVKEEIGDRQREVYLREQLRAIQKELGEGDESRRRGAQGAQGQARRAPAPRRGPQGGRRASGRG